MANSDKSNKQAKNKNKNNQRPNDSPAARRQIHSRRNKENSIW